MPTPSSTRWCHPRFSFASAGSGLSAPTPGARQGRLGDGACHTAYAAGAALTPDAASAEALATADAPDSASQGKPSS